MGEIDDSARGLEIATMMNQPASVMDGLCVSYFRPETDVEKHLDLQLKLWNMPPKTTDGAGYWPGLGPIFINGQLCCSTCKQLLTDVIDSGPSDKECNDLTSIATFEIDKSPDSLSNVRSAMSYSVSLSVDVDG
jgi:hypothetical protein